MRFNRRRQEEFLNTCAKNNFNVTKTCDEIGISKDTFYKHLKKDDNFRLNYTTIKEYCSGYLADLFMDGLANESTRMHFFKMLTPSVLEKLISLRLELPKNIDSVDSKSFNFTDNELLGDEPSE